jgi:4'-phosphopantetheinyl transferase
MTSIDIFFSDIREWDTCLLKESLDSHEILKLSSIKHVQTYQQKVVSRFLLKYILRAKYGFNEEKVQFDYNDRGKPRLRNFPDFHFNCSHSGHYILIGSSHDSPIGVDIELVKEVDNEEEIAKRFFSEDEFINYLDYAKECPSAFFHFWTAKEAVIKALGKGLWEANIVPEIYQKEGRFYLIREGRVLEDWSIVFPIVSPDYIACIAIQIKEVIPNIIQLSKSTFLNVFFDCCALK